MTKVILAITLAASCGLYAFAQTSDAAWPLKVELEADSMDRLFVEAGTDSPNQTRAYFPFRYFGNVVIVINDVRITARSAIWHEQGTRLELNDGEVRIELPREPTALKIATRLKGQTR